MNLLQAGRAVSARSVSWLRSASGMAFGTLGSRGGQMLEPLEERKLLTGDYQNVVARLEGQVAAGQGSVSMPFAIDTRDFVLSGGSVVLGFHVKNGAGSVIDPGTPAVRTQGGVNVAAQAPRADLSAGQSVALFELSAGSYVLTVPAERGSSGAFVVDVVLVGDVDANRTVNQGDSSLLRQAFGRRTGQAGFDLEADANFDGWISSADEAYLLRNLADRSFLGVLSLTAGLDPAAASTLPDGTLATNQSRPTLAGQALIGAPGASAGGATIDLDLDNDGQYDDGRLTADANGNYRYTMAQALADGVYTFGVRATDRFGQARTRSLRVLIDTISPATLTTALDASTDSAPVGDNRTSFARVTLTGETEPGAVVRVVGQDVSATAGANGRYTLGGVALVEGANALVVRATDAAGNIRDAGITITRVVSNDPAQPLFDWTNAMLDAVTRSGDAPPQASRVMAMVSAAMYDAINAITGGSSFVMVRLTSPGGASPAAAAIAAAHRVLSRVYAAQANALDALRASSLAQIPAGPSRDDGVALGTAVADAVLLLRADDGAYDYVDYIPGTAPGVWQPTAPAFAPALLPNWASVTPFAMSGPDQFRPAGPWALDSSAYTADYEQVRDLGRADSTSRTADQTQIARFWADGAGTYTPAGHWNQIAASIASARGLSLFDTARLMARLNVALADASIVAWDAKYTYNSWRPITAIQRAGEDGNSDTSPDASWFSLINTPPFPDYVSGHSTYSGAAERILAATFGESFAFSAGSPTLPGVTRNYDSFAAAATEASLSRVYGGIHFKKSCDDGLAAGRALGDYVLARLNDQQDTVAPVVSVSSPSSDAAFSQVFQVTGRVVDGLSLVASFEYQLDNAAYTPASFDSSGNFSFPISLARDGTADGSHVLRFRARDSAGNTSSPVERRFTFDSRNPTLVLQSPQNGATLPVGARLTGSTDGTGTPIRSLAYTIDGGVSIPVTLAPGGAFDQPLALAEVGVGTHTLVLTTTDLAGNVASLTRTFVLASRIPLTLSAVSPGEGSSDVGVTQRPRVDFSRAVDPASINADSLYLSFSGQRLAANITVSQDGRYAMLFPTSPLPGGAQVMLTVVGGSDSTPGIRAASGGPLLDADNNGAPGGTLSYSFSTVYSTPVPGTTIQGVLADPGSDLIPGSFDDVRAGPDGVLMTLDDVYQRPIAGVHVYILGRQGLPGSDTVTDELGRFTLTNVPVGSVKVIVDGRTATGIGAPNPGPVPTGVYFPEMTMDVTVEPGRVNYVMSGMRTAMGSQTATEALGVYLPRINDAALRPLNENAPTEIRVRPEDSPRLSEQQREALMIEVPPNSLVDENGVPVADANMRVGISTVPAELVRDMLPPGVLQHSFDITVQAPGVGAFRTPAPMTFPNVFNAAPGTQLNFLSFDHTTGRLVIEGTATVSADGRTVRTDPGTGITKPGWHGLVPPGGFFDFIPKLLDQCNMPGCDCLGMALAAGGIAAGVVGAFASAPAVATAAAFIGLGTAIGGVVNDLYRDGTVSNLSQKSAAVGSFGLATDFVSRFRAGDASSIARRWGWDPSADGRTRFYRNMSRDVRSVGGVASRVLSAGGGLLSALDLADKLANCNPPLGDHPGLEGMLAQLRAAFDDVFEAVRPLIEPRLAPLLPETREVVVFGDESGVVRAFNADGTPYITPGNGQPMRLHISDVLEPRWYSDATYRIAASTALAQALERVAAVFSASNPLLDAAAREIEAIFAQGRAHLASEAGGAIQTGNLFYRVTDLSTGQELSRGTLSGNNNSIVIAPSAMVQVELVEPSTLAYGRTIVTSAASGSRISYGNFYLGLDQSGDQDGDGLGDLSEDVIGTDRRQSDSDGDGVQDGAALRAGLDPTGGRSLPIGIIASQSVNNALQSAQARDIAVEGSLTDSAGLTAYVATGTAGLSVFDVTRFRSPTLLGQVDLPGDAVSVAIEPRMRLAVVGTGATGVSIVDVSNPMMPRIRPVQGTINVDASLVAAYEGVAYVATGTQVRAYDLSTGELLQRIDFGSGNTVTRFAREGRFLYAIDSGNTLRVLSVEDSGLRARATVRVTQSTSGKLTVSGGIAYIGVGNGNQGGVVTVDVSNPDALGPSVLITANNIAGGMVVPNGSGSGVSIGSLNGIGNVLHVLRIPNPSQPATFVTQITLPAAPSALTIAGGLAFVANGTEGLQVVNFLALDTQRTAPTLNVDSAILDMDPSLPGIQVQERSTMRLGARVTDDVQVRNVELLLDDGVVVNDVTFPFDLSAVAPVAVAGGSTITLRVRATDTGGNIAISDPITIQIVRDTFAPRLVRQDPVEGAVRGLNFQSTLIGFSESLDAATATESAVWLVGPSGNRINPTSVQLRANDTQLALSFAGAALPVGNYRLVIDREIVRDRAGNRLGVGLQETAFSIQAFTAVWIGPRLGNWSDPANWDVGRVPNVSDDVLVPGALSVVNINSTVRVGTMQIEGILRMLPGAALTVSRTSEVRGELQAEAGTSLTAEAALLTITGNTTIDGVSLYANNGGRILASGVTQYTNVTTRNDQTTRFQATGAGSLISLPNITRLYNGTAYNTNFIIEALQGGRVNLSAAQFLIDPNSGDGRYRAIAVRADGVGSQVDLSNLYGLYDFTASVYRSDLENRFSSFVASGGGTIFVPRLTTVVGVDFVLDDLGTIALPNLGTALNSRFSVAVNRSLPQLRVIDGSSIEVRNGATFTLANVASYINTPTRNDEYRYFRASGAGSVLSMAGLLKAENGTAYNTNLNIEAIDGGRVSMPNLIEVSDPNLGDQRFRAVVLQASGSGSRLELNALRSVRDFAASVVDPDNDWRFSRIVASGGGTVVVPLLRTIVGVDLNISGSGNFNNSSNQFSQLFSAIFSRITVSVPASFSTLAIIDGTSIEVNNSIQLSLPGVQSYANTTLRNDEYRYLRALGSGSQLILPSLVSITNGLSYNTNLTIEAIQGGRIRMASLQEIIDPNLGDQRYRGVRLVSTGDTSSLELPGLRVFRDYQASVADPSNDWRFSAIAATQGGRIDLTALRMIQGVNFALAADLSVVIMPSLEQAFNAVVTLSRAFTFNQLRVLGGSTVDVSGGVSISFPLVTIFGNGATRNDEEHVLRASGAGTTLSFPNLTWIENGVNYNTRLSLIATGGGRLLLPSVTDLHDPNEGDLRFRRVVVDANGDGSLVDLSSLRKFTDMSSSGAPGSQNGPSLINVNAATLRLGATTPSDLTGVLVTLTATARIEGSFRLGSGSILDNQSVSSVITGSLINAGTIRLNTPTGGPGTVLSVGGSFTNDAAGTINVSIIGSGATQYGRINITGSATLAGTLRPSFDQGYAPGAGAVFSWMRYGSRTGEFGMISPVNLPAGFTIVPQYGATDMVLRIA